MFYPQFHLYVPEPKLIGEAEEMVAAPVRVYVI